MSGLRKRAVKLLVVLMLAVAIPAAATTYFSYNQYIYISTNGYYWFGTYYWDYSYWDWSSMSSSSGYWWYSLPYGTWKFLLCYDYYYGWDEGVWLEDTNY